MVGDELYILKTTWKNYGFINAFGGNGGFDADLTTGGTLHLEWPELVANGGEVEARGILETTIGSGLFEAGNCLEGSDFSGNVRVDGDGKGGTFVLRDLRRKPYCGG